MDELMRGSARRAVRAVSRARTGFRTRIVAYALVAVLGVSTAGIASAITTGLIYACVNNSSGTIKIVDATTACSSNEIQLVWNAEGVAGPKGDKGDAGPKGEPGARGPSDAFTVSAKGPLTLQPTPTMVAKLNLPAGTYLISANVWLANESAATVEVTCELLAGGGSSKSGAALESGGASAGTVSLTLGQELTSASTADLSCSSASSGGGLARMREAQLTGLMVANLVKSTVGAPSHTLTVTTVGAGSGTVESSPAGITCGTSCAFNYPDGTRVTLTATPTTASFFGAWDGACPPLPVQCVVTVDTPKTVVAAFGTPTAVADYVASFASESRDPSPRDGAPDASVWIWSRSGDVLTAGFPGLGFAISDGGDTSSLLFSHPTTPVCSAGKTALVRATSTTQTLPSSSLLVTHGWRLILDDGCGRLELKLVRTGFIEGSTHQIRVEGTSLKLEFPWGSGLDETYEIERLTNGDFVIRADAPGAVVAPQSLNVPAFQLPPSSGRPEFVWGAGLGGRGTAEWSNVHGEVR